MLENDAAFSPLFRSITVENPENPSLPTFSKNRPTCVRWSEGRSRSRNPTTRPLATRMPTNVTIAFTVRRRPSRSQPSSANAGAEASVPPKSCPNKGGVSATNDTASTARAIRTPHGGGSRHATRDAMSTAEVESSADDWFPMPEKRMPTVAE